MKESALCQTTKHDLKNLIWFWLCHKTIHTCLGAGVRVYRTLKSCIEC